MSFAQAQSKTISFGNSNNIYGSTFNQSNNTTVKNVTIKKTIYYESSYKLIDVIKSLLYYKDGFKNLLQLQTMEVKEKDNCLGILVQIDSLLIQPLSYKWSIDYYELNKNIIAFIFSIAEKKGQLLQLFNNNEFGSQFAISNQIEIDRPSIEVYNAKPYINNKLFLRDSTKPINSIRIFPFVGGFARFLENGKFGVINSLGKTIIQPTFDLIWDYSEGYFLVQNDREFYFLDTAQVSLLNLSAYTEVTPFKNGLSKCLNSTGTINFINKEGTLLKVKYNSINNKKKTTNYTTEFSKATEFNVGKAAVAISNTTFDYEYFIDTLGNIIRTNDEMSFFSGFNDYGLAVYQNTSIGYSYYLFDSSFKVRSKNYDEIKVLKGFGFWGITQNYITNNNIENIGSLFDEKGILRKSNFKNFSILEYDSKIAIIYTISANKNLCGVINKYGAWILDPIYEKIEIVADGVIETSKNGVIKSFTINKEGFLEN